MTDTSLSALAVDGPYRPRRPSPWLSALRGVREVGYRVANGTGLSRALSTSAWRRERLLILCYHGVSIADEHEWSDLYVSQELLDRRLAWMRRNRCTVLPLHDAVTRLRDGTLPDRAVAITFDDGAVDFALRAMPVLAAHRAPATVYLTTYYHQHALPVYDTALSYLMWKGAERRFRFPLDGTVYTAPPRNAPDARTTLQFAFMRQASEAGLDAYAKQSVLAALAAELGVDFDAFVDRRQLQIMSPADVAGLDLDLVRLELHTHRHRTPHDRALFLRELDDNRRVIEGLQPGLAPRHFCYPSGQYTAEQVQWLHDTGIASATTCNPGLATRQSPPLLLPRLIDSEGVSEAKFAAWALGLGALLHP